MKRIYTALFLLTGTYTFAQTLPMTDNTFTTTGTNLPVAAFTMAPNPASTYVTIRQSLEDATVHILETDGKEVMVVKHVGGMDQISLVNLQPGTYWVVVTQEGMAPSQQRLMKL